MKHLSTTSFDFLMYLLFIGFFLESCSTNNTEIQYNKQVISLATDNDYNPNTSISLQTLPINDEDLETTEEYDYEEDLETTEEYDYKEDSESTEEYDLFSDDEKDTSTRTSAEDQNRFPVLYFILEDPKKCKGKIFLTEKKYESLITIKKEESIKHSSYCKSKVDVQSIIDLHKKIFDRINCVDSYNKLKSWLYNILNKHTTQEVTELIIIWQDLSLHIENILIANYFKEIPPEDKITLVNLLHKINYKIAKSSLATICYIATNYQIGMIINQNPALTQNINSYKQAEIQLKKYFGINKKLLMDYLGKIDNLYTVTIMPYLYLDKLFHPQSLKEQANKDSVKQKTPKALTSSQAEEYIDNYIEDKELANKIKAFYTQFRACIYLKQDLDSYKKLAKKFLNLEKTLIEMLVSNLSHIGEPTQQVEKMYQELNKNVPNFYRNISPSLKIGIISLIIAGYYREGLIRLASLRDIYLKQDNITSEFIIFEANAYALCGKYEKLNQLYIDKIRSHLKQKEKKLQIKQRQHNQKIAAIKHIQQAASMPLTKKYTSRKTIPTLSSDPKKDQKGESVYDTQTINSQQAKKEKLDRHKIADKKRKKHSKEELHKDKERLISSKLTKKEMLPVCTNLKFYLPKKSYNTISKIFKDDWKIARKEIENLFETLGQDVNDATKSSHHIIKISRRILLIEEEKIIGEIPDLSETMNGHISLPKWDKEVPYYMRSYILKMIEAIGMHAENYSKGTGEKHTKFIAITS